MLQITAEEINFIIYQYLQESGFSHSAYTFGKESNIIENKYRHFHIPAGMLIVFLEKALTLIHIETHYSEGDDMVVGNEPFSLLNPHHCSTIVSVKKPGVQNQTNIRSGIDSENQNPLDSIINNQGRTAAFENNPSAYKADANSRSNDNMDKEMQDESKGNYDAQNSLMSKSKDSGIPDSVMQHTPFSRQVSLLQDNGNKIKVLQSDSERTMKVSWNPKNHLLAFGGDKELGYLWNLDEDLDSASKISVLPHSLPDFAKPSSMYEQITVMAMDWKYDGSMLVTGSNDGFGRLWDERGDGTKIIYNEHSMPLKLYSGQTTGASDFKVPSKLEDFDTIYDCKWNKDGTAFVTVSEKNNVILWSAEGKLKHSYQGHTDSVMGVDWKNNNQFATGSQDGIIKIWDVQSSPAIKTYNAHENVVKGVKWDHSGALLASASEDCSIKIWSPKHDKPLFTFNENKEMINSLKWSPTGLGTQHESMDVRLASCSSDGTIKIWNMNDGKGVDTLTGHNGMVMGLDYDPTYKYLVSGDHQGRIIIWSVKDGTIIKTFENKKKKCIFDAQWSYDGIMLALGYDDVSVVDIRYM